MSISIQWITGGGVTSPKGYKACGIAAGLKVDRTDMALLASDRPAHCAGLFTSNNVPAAPVLYDKPLVAKGKARAVIVNVGCANACTGEPGRRDAACMGETAAKALGIPAEEMLVCSTGTIGRRLAMDRILAGIPRLAEGISAGGGSDAAWAILTTDTVPKQAAVHFEANGRVYTVGGMCKGAGMICPNLATTLIFLTTDAKVSASALRKAVKIGAEHSFNRITVDGDQSTNDTLLLFANGAAGGPALAPGKPGWSEFLEAVSAVQLSLAQQIVRDGEGATKFVTVSVEKAATPADALAACRAIANSPLFKTACFGGDPNWGRVISAVGNSGAKCAELETEIYFDKVCVFDKGVVADAQANEALSSVMAQRAFTVRVVLNRGTCADAVYTTDFSYEYVKINGEYTT